MSMPQGEARRGGLVLISLALFAGLLGAVLYAEGYGSHSPAMRDLGFLAVMAGTLLAIRASAARTRARRAQSAECGERPVPTAAGRSGRMVRTIGVALCLLGIALFAAVPLSWATRLFGLVVAMAGVLVVRTSFDHLPSRGAESRGEAAPKAVGRFDRATRVTGAALVPLMAFSTVALYRSAASGYHEAWPLYTFFVVALACALVWAYLFGRLLVRLAVGGRGR